MFSELFLVMFYLIVRCLREEAVTVLLELSSMCSVFCCFFFFQAEDGIRDDLVTGVQTCALPISQRSKSAMRDSASGLDAGPRSAATAASSSAPSKRGAAAANGNPISDSVTRREIGRASCRERV